MNDQPAPSVTGNREWEWNSLQTGPDAGSGTTETAKRPSSYRKENEELRRRIEILEAELERRDRRIQRIVDQYEQLLAARDRQLQEARDETARHTDDAQLLAEIRRLLDG